MAASTVEKGGVRKSSGLRTTLSNPYTVNWPTLDKKTYHAIMNAIGRHFPATLNQKQKKISKKKRKMFESSNEPLSEADKILKEQLDEKQSLRQCLAVGINEVTKGLERDELSLVLVDRSVKPVTMTDHLMLIGATRRTPTLGLHEIGQLLASLLGQKRAGAIGFKKQRPSTYFDSLIEYITTKVPDIAVPWLNPFDDKAPVDDTPYKENESSVENANSELKASTSNTQDELIQVNKDNGHTNRKRRLSSEKEGIGENNDNTTKQRKLNDGQCESTNKETSSQNDATAEIISDADGVDIENQKKIKINKDTNQQSPDFGMITVVCQPPVVKTVGKGTRTQEKKEKKKKKK